MDLLQLVLLAGATARLTFLAVYDGVFDRPRDALEARLERGDHPQLLVLMSCPWCVSVYVGAAVAGSWWVWGDERWWFAVCAGLTASLFTGALAEKVHP